MLESTMRELQSDLRHGLACIASRSVYLSPVDASMVSQANKWAFNRELQFSAGNAASVRWYAGNIQRIRLVAADDSDDPTSVEYRPSADVLALARGAGARI